MKFSCSFFRVIKFCVSNFRHWKFFCENYTHVVHVHTRLCARINFHVYNFHRLCEWRNIFNSEHFSIYGVSWVCMHCLAGLPFSPFYFYVRVRKLCSLLCTWHSCTYTHMHIIQLCLIMPITVCVGIILLLHRPHQTDRERVQVSVYIMYIL